MDADWFIHFLNTSSLQNYKVGTEYDNGKLEYLGESPIDGKYYALNDYTTLWVSSDNLVTLITVLVKDYEFRQYMSTTHGVKSLTLKKMLMFLAHNELEWEIDSKLTFAKQFTIKLKSGVQFYFALSNQLEYRLTGILTSYY